MKKFYSLILSLFISAFAFADNAEYLTKSVTFNFRDPFSLSENFSMEGYSYKSVLDSVFVSGPIQMSFSANRLNPSIVYDSDNKSGYLWGVEGNYISIRVISEYQDQCDLVEVALDNDSWLGGFVLTYGSKGTFNTTTKTWTNSDTTDSDIDGVKDIQLFNNQGDSRIYGFTVKYRTPLDVLLTQSVSPAEDEIVNSFSEMTLTFDQAVESVGSDFELLDEDGKKVATLAMKSINGKTVVLSCDEIVEPGTYTVNFPKASFVTADKTYNKAFSTSFVIEEPKNTFNPSPAIEEQEAEVFPSEIVISFDGNIGNVDDLVGKEFDIIGRKNGKVGNVTVAKGDNPNEIKLLSSQQSLTYKDIYTVTIPEQTIYDVNYGSTSKVSKYNSEINIVYKVAGADAPSDENLALAEKVLALTGVGYPSAENQIRQQIQDIIDNPDDHSDIELTNLLESYMTSDDIELPEAGKYYILTNIQPDDTRYYLSYADGAVSVVKDADDAYGFTAGDATSFATYDGKYLALLGSNTQNISDEKVEFTLSRFNLDGVSTEKSFGMMTIKNGSYYMTVESDGNIRKKESSVTFNEDFSGAWILTETSEPKIVTPYTVTLDPVPASAETVDSLKSITITFEQAVDMDATLAQQIVITGSDSGNDIAPTSVTASEDKKSYVLKFAALPNDDYELTIPEGTFTYSIGTYLVKVQEITKDFTVYMPDEFQKTLFNKNIMALRNDWAAGASLNASQLNNLKFEVEDTDYKPIITYVDETKEVKLIYNYVTTVTRGKMTREIVEESETQTRVYRKGVDMGRFVALDEDGTISYWTDEGAFSTLNFWGRYDSNQDELVERVVVTPHAVITVNFPIELNDGNCPNGIYHFVFPEASIGDEAFSQYLAGEPVLRKSCVVNADFVYPVQVDYTTAIKNISSEDNDAALYDISGRRIANGAKAGLYIKNGKKYVVK